MSRVMTFSRVYPSYHPKAGMPTYFVEKIWESLGREYSDPGFVREYMNYMCLDDSFIWAKHHTIRAGQNWKAGDWFSPRAWSGKPYNSKQITFAPDIQVKKTWRIDIDVDGCVFINGELYAYPNSYFALEPLAANDGLTVSDLFCWFKNRPIKDHQIICWNESIEY